MLNSIKKSFMEKSEAAVIHTFTNLRGETRIAKLIGHEVIVNIGGVVFIVPQPVFCLFNLLEDLKGSTNEGLIQKLQMCGKTTMDFEL